METNLACTSPIKPIKQGRVVMRAHGTSASYYKHLAIAILLSFALPTLAQETPGHVVGTKPYSFDTVNPREEAPEVIELPESVIPMLEGLSSQDIELLKSGRAQKYTGCFAVSYTI